MCSRVNILGTYIQSLQPYLGSICLYTLYISFTMLANGLMHIGKNQDYDSDNHDITTSYLQTSARMLTDYIGGQSNS